MGLSVDETLFSLWQKVHCNHGHVTDRDTFQQWLAIANPRWKEFMDNLEVSGQKPRTNPDGDVSLLVPSRPPSCQEKANIAIFFDFVGGTRRSLL